MVLFSFADAVILRYTGCNQYRGIALLPPPTTAAILNHLTASAGGLSVYQLRDALDGDASISDLSDQLSILSHQGLVHLVKGHL